MADTAKRLYGPAQAASTAATLYTVPASTTTILRYIRVSNTTGTDRTFTLSIGADAAATRIFSGMTIPNGGSVDWSGFIPMTTGEILQGYASVASALTVTVAGVEVTP